MIGIPVGTNCAPLLAYLSLHTYEADFLQGLLKNKDRKLSQTFNSSFRYIDDVLWLNNSQFGDYQYRIYPKLRILLIIKSLLLTLTFTLKLPTKEDQKKILWQMWWLHFSNSQFSF